MKVKIFILIILFIFLCAFIMNNSYSNNEYISINDNIPKYLINLDRRQDRLLVTEKLLNENGYKNIIRFSAIDGTNLDNHILTKIVDKQSLDPIYNKKRTEDKELSFGAVGCYLSHVNLWNKIENDIFFDYAIIFEDDTNPTINKDKLNEFLLKSPKDWDIITLGCFYNPKKNYTDSVFDKIDRFFCLHAYIINKKAIAKIKPHLYPLKVQIDWLLSDLSSDDKLNIYVIKNSDWYQNTKISSTDIQTPMITN